MSSWTDDRVAELKDHLKVGLSAGQIGKLMRVSRNAIIGKCHRLGWSLSDEAARQAMRLGGARGLVSQGKRAPSGPKAPPRPVKTRIVPKTGLIYDAAPDVPVAPLRTAETKTEPRHWLTRRFGECCYPVDGDGADTFSCCAPVDRQGYCKPHADICFTPPKTTVRELQRGLRRYAAA